MAFIQEQPEQGVGREHRQLNALGGRGCEAWGCTWGLDSSGELWEVREKCNRAEPRVLTVRLKDILMQ